MYDCICDATDIFTFSGYGIYIYIIYIIMIHCIYIIIDMYIICIYIYVCVCSRITSYVLSIPWMVPLSCVFRGFAPEEEPNAGFLSGLVSAFLNYTKHQQELLEHPRKIGMKSNLIYVVEFSMFMVPITYCWWFRNPELISWGKGSLSHYLQGFYTSRVVIAGFQPSTVPLCLPCWAPPKPGWGREESHCLGLRSRQGLSCSGEWSQDDSGVRLERWGLGDWIPPREPSHITFELALLSRWFSFSLGGICYCSCLEGAALEV